MPTNQSEIFDLFMTQVKDYKLVNLYQDSEEDFLTYLQGWLVQACADFAGNTETDLTFDTSDGDFNVDLSNIEKTILATIMVQYWLEKETKDIMQMNLHLQDRDFKVYAEGQNLKEKENSLTMLREKIAQKITEYTYNNNNWSDWFSGNFYTV